MFIVRREVWPGIETNFLGADCEVVAEAEMRKFKSEKAKGKAAVVQ